MFKASWFKLPTLSILREILFPDDMLGDAFRPMKNSGLSFKVLKRGQPVIKKMIVIPHLK